MNHLTCVVTGGAGFMGSHLVERLLAEGNRVRVLDNLSNGRLENLAHLKNNPSLNFVHGDVTEADTTHASLFEQVDQVYHLAALADIVPSIQNPTAYHRSNVDGTFSVLQASRIAGVKRLMYTASSSCYGLPDIFPTPETAAARPMYPYALTKYLGEQMAMHWHQVYGLPVTSLRLFNVYGPRARTSGTYGAVFGVFLAQKLAGKPMTIVGDGRQTRDFTFVTDVADAFFTAAGSPKTVGGIFNIGSGGTYSVNRLVELLGGEKVYIPKRPGEPDCTFADVNKIRQAIGWQAKVPLEQGVAEMLKHIDAWRQAPVWDPGSIAKATQDWFKYLSATSDRPPEVQPPEVQPPEVQPPEVQPPQVRPLEGASR